MGRCDEGIAGCTSGPTTEQENSWWDGRRPTQDTAAKFRTARNQTFTIWAEVTGVSMASQKRVPPLLLDPPHLASANIQQLDVAGVLVPTDQQGSKWTSRSRRMVTSM